MAYGISVSATMLIDTLLLALVARSLWPRARGWILALCVPFFLLLCIPVVNLVVAFQLTFLRGTTGPNRFGPDPLDACVALPVI